MTARRGAAIPDRNESIEPRTQAGFESAIEIRRGAASAVIVPAEPVATASPATPRTGLSNRALNVLKILAAEMTGECPPRQRWTPSPALLREITYKQLVTARNCGSQTINEIMLWAQLQGVTIQPPYHAGKSLAETWRVLRAKSAAGDLVHAEMAEALGKSVRRKNTTIPVEIQKLLLQLLEMGA